MTKDDLFREVTKHILSPESGNEETLAWMILLHTHGVRLAPQVQLSDAASQGTQEFQH